MQNNNEAEYKGIGRAADRIAVEFCKKLGFKPNVISVSTSESIIAHYKRGKRFISVDQNMNTNSLNFIKKFHTADPNLVIQKRIKESGNGEAVVTNDLGELVMYLPQEMIEKYQKLAEENPILH